MTTGNAHLFELRLRGQTFRLRTQTDGELTRETVLVAQRVIDDVEKKTGAQPVQNQVLLALLALAEEYVGARKRFEGCQKDWDEKLKQILEELSDDGTERGESPIPNQNPGLATEFTDVRDSGAFIEDRGEGVPGISRT